MIEMNTHKSGKTHPGITILLVDDQPAVRFGLQLLFQLEVEPLRFCEAGNSAEALAMIDAWRPDVVIMDVNLPDRDGIFATKQLTRVWPHCLVIVLTIHNRPDIRLQALAAGAWAFVEKGRPEDMRFALRQAIHLLKSAPPSVSLIL
jgi:DNA-binding NarL/FixJ family response regulator